jgi:hypothetical protein
MRIGARVIEPARAVLRVYEVAFVVRRSEQEIRNMLRRVAFRPAGGGRTRCVDPREVAELVAEDQLALAVLAAIVEGRLEAPKAVHPTFDPPPLIAR